MAVMRAAAIVVLLASVGCTDSEPVARQGPAAARALTLSDEIAVAVRWSRAPEPEQRQAALRILRALMVAPASEADRAQVEARARQIIARDDTRYVLVDAIAVLAMVTRGDRVAELIQIVERGTKPARSAAAEALVVAAGPADLEAVLAALGPFEDSAVLENSDAIVEYLARVGGEPAARALLSLLVNTKSSKAEALGETLATMRASTSLLIEALEALAAKAHYPKGREAIIETLVRRGDPDATAALLTILRRRDAYIQEEVIDALAQMRDPAAAVALVERYKTSKPGSGERARLEKALRDFPGVVWPAPRAERPANLAPSLVPEAQLRALAGAYRARHASDK